jgi:hypothetical protein
MGELADDFRFMKEARAKKRAEKEPSRFEYATDALMEADCTVRPNSEDPKCLIVNGYIRFWPYTGWYSGKGVGSGRGIKNLLKQLAPQEGEMI